MIVLNLSKTIKDVTIANYSSKKRTLMSLDEESVSRFLEEKDVELAEGTGHNGKSAIIRFVGKKI